MTIAPAVFLYLLLTVAFVFWVLPKRTGQTRSLFLIVASGVAVFLISPTALVVAVITSIVASIVSSVLVARKSPLLLATAIAAVISILVLARAASPTTLDIIDLTGSAFFCLKAIAIIADAYRFGRSTKILDSLLLILFFPTYEAGPIEQPRTLNRTSCTATFDLTLALGGVGRIAVGLLKQAYIGPIILAGLANRFSPWVSGQLVEGGHGILVIWLILQWLQIYVMFSGYSDVAIGAGRLVGIRIRENFNFPFLATNLQDFWKRWHISLIDFMSMYVYQPFVRRTGWRYRGIIVLFLLTGLWHAFTLQYMLWGLLHGSVMASLARWQKSETGHRFREHVSQSRWLSLAMGIAARLGTVLFVAWVSAIGGAESWAKAVQIVSLGAITFAQH